LVQRQHRGRPLALPVPRRRAGGRAALANHVAGACRQRIRLWNTGLPETWTLYSATVSGLAAPVNVCVAFRYFVTQGGPSGANSHIMGVDAFNYAPIPEPGTWALMAGGIAGLLAWRRRQQAAR